MPAPELTLPGRLVLAAAAAFLAATVLLDAALPPVLAAFGAALLCVSLAGRFVLGRVAVGTLLPAVFAEGDRGELELELALPRPWPALPVELALQADCFHAPSQGTVVTGATRAVLRVGGLLRGHAREARLVLETAAPFGLVRHRRQVALACDVRVTPVCRSLRAFLLEQMLRLPAGGFHLPEPMETGDSEFYALREFRAGDPERRVHPRLSARRGRKMLRVFRGEAPAQVDVLLDCRVPRATRAFERPDFDESVRFTAGVVRTLLLRSVPIRLGFVHADRIEEVVHPSARLLAAYLTALAEARPEPEGDLDPLARIGAPSPKVLVHQGIRDEARLPAAWLCVHAGSRRYFQLVEPRLARVGAA